MKKIKFNDFIRLQRGFDLPNAQISYGKYPVVASTSIMNYHNEYKVKGPVVITGRSGSLGVVQYIDEDCWPLNTTLYTKDFHGNIPKYVYYFLKTLHLEQYNAGAGVPTLNQNHLHHLNLLIHDVKEQDVIASILSSYDDLIEKNNRKIAILQEQAQEIYKEWFVRFRFPGYKTAKFKDKLPLGWSYNKLQKIFVICYGKDHSKIDKGLIPIYGSGGIMRYGNKAIYNGESVLIPRKGSLNHIMWVDGEFWTVDTMFYTKALIPNVEKYLFYVLSSIDMESFNSGAALPSMTTDILYHLKVLVPTKSLLKKFDDVITKKYVVIDYLKKQNELLISQRDLLLPRLMSGKLKVH
jgi:type I restriction enzyme S subunit